MHHITTIEGQLTAQGLKFALVVGRFNDFISERLVGGAVDYLTRHGADRADITEELVRLQSHFAQTAEALQQGGVVGRTLDFLVIEMGREINTIGAKANDAAIARLVVTGKTELERVREQVQNIE